MAGRNELSSYCWASPAPTPPLAGFSAFRGLPADASAVERAGARVDVPGRERADTARQLQSAGVRGRNFPPRLTRACGPEDASGAPTIFPAASIPRAAARERRTPPGRAAGTTTTPSKGATVAAIRPLHCRLLLAVVRAI